MTKRQRAAPPRGTCIFGVIADVLGGIAKEEYASERQEDQQQFNASEASIQRQWAEHMQNTQYQRMTKDLEAANLNPILAYSKLAGGVPSVSAASSGIASPGSGPSVSQGLQSAAQTEVLEATKDRTKAETDKIKAEEDEIRARTPTHAVSMDRMRQEIAESVQRIGRIVEETRHHASSAKHLDQQVANLQAQIPQIEATIEQLRQQARVGAQQVKTGKAEEHRHYIESGRAGAQDEETRQRIRANLPALEAAWKEIQNHLADMKRPQAGMQAATHHTFLGAWNAALRALLGMESK